MIVAHLHVTNGSEVAKIVIPIVLAYVMRLLKEGFKKEPFDQNFCIQERRKYEESL